MYNLERGIKMEIDNCGKHSEKLNEIMDDIIEQNRRKKEKFSVFEIGQLDRSLFESYQKILSMSPDGDSIAKALNYFGEQVKNGNVDINQMTKIAAESAAKAQEEIESNQVSTENVASAVANTVLLDAALYHAMENSLIEEICSPEMEEAHRETYENAEQGDAKALITLDLINRAKTYMVYSDKLNEKGKEAGALALIAQLTDAGTPEAVMMAKKMVEYFGIKDVLSQDGNIDIEAVKSRFGEKAPHVDIDKVEEKMSQRAVDNKDKLLEISSSSLMKDIMDRFRKREVTDYRRAVKDALDRGDREEARRLASERPDLAKEAEEEIEKQRRKLEEERKILEDLRAEAEDEEYER